MLLYHSQQDVVIRPNLWKYTRSLRNETHACAAFFLREFSESRQCCVACIFYHHLATHSFDSHRPSGGYCHFLPRTGDSNILFLTDWQFSDFFNLTSSTTQTKVWNFELFQRKNFFVFTFSSLIPDQPTYFVFYTVLFYHEIVHLTYFILFFMYIMLITGLCAYSDALTQDLKIIVEKLDQQKRSDCSEKTLRQTIDLQNNIAMWVMSTFYVIHQISWNRTQNLFLTRIAYLILNSSAHSAWYWMFWPI